MLSEMKNRFNQTVAQFVFKLQVSEIKLKCANKGMEKFTFTDRNKNDWCCKFSDQKNIYKVYYSAGYPRVEFLKDVGDVNENTGEKLFRMVGSLWSNWRFDVHDEEDLLELLRYFELTDLIHMVEEKRQKKLA